MPEVVGYRVRVRITVDGEVFERWQVLARLSGVPVERLIVNGAEMALPALERRMEALARPLTAAEVGGTSAAAGTAPAVDAGGGAGVPRAAESRVEYRSVGSNLPLRGSGGGKKRGRH